MLLYARGACIPMEISMKFFSLSLAAVMFLGLAATPSLFAEKAAPSNDKPAVVCPNSDCTKSCCKQDEKNRMKCTNSECGKEQKKSQDCH